jgi:hypothetical protein
MHKIHAMKEHNGRTFTSIYLYTILTLSGRGGSPLDRECLCSKFPFYYIPIKGRFQIYSISL